MSRQDSIRSVHRRYHEKQMVNQFCLEYVGQRGDEEAIKKIKEKIASDKRDYRRELRMEDLRQKRNYHARFGDGTVVNEGGDWDYCWYKVFFPNERWTDEEKREYADYVWIRYVPTYYDCTGQIFTRFVDAFNVPNGVVVYIRDCMDV